MTIPLSHKLSLATCLAVVMSLASCSIPESKTVAAHAAGELMTVPSAALNDPSGGAPLLTSPEAAKAQAFWGKVGAQ